MSNELEVLDDDFVKIVKDIEKDILDTRYNIISKANKEVVNFYLRLGKIISDNAKYGNNFINRLSVALKLDFPDEQGFSARNLARMRKVYEAYKDLASIPEELEIISWSQNCVLVDKIEDIDKRVWYAKQIIENGWSKTVLSHQIDLELYERQALPEKMTNFNDKLPIAQSEFARDMIKDPYIFELANIGKRAKERDIENAMLERIKNVLLELGKGFSFVGNQYKISTNDNDYYIDLLFYHLDLRCFVVVELKNTEFKPEYVGQLGFYVTAVDETLKKETDNETIGLLLCEDKDKLTVEWSLKNVNAPIGVASYKVKNVIPTEIMEKLPTEEELNLYIKKLPNEEIEEKND